MIREHILFGLNSFETPYTAWSFVETHPRSFQMMCVLQLHCCAHLSWRLAGSIFQIIYILADFLQLYYWWLAWDPNASTQSQWTGTPFSCVQVGVQRQVPKHLSWSHLPALHLCRGSLPSVSLLTSILSDVSVATQALLPLLCAWAILSHHFIFWLPHGVWDPSSTTRDRTWTPCIGSMESYPLDFQQSPPPLLSTHFNSKMSLWHSTQLDLAFLSARLSHIWCRDHLTLNVNYGYSWCCPLYPHLLLSFLVSLFLPVGMGSFLAAPWGVQNLNFPTGDQNQAPCGRRGSPNHWKPGSYPFGV